MIAAMRNMSYEDDNHRSFANNRTNKISTSAYSRLYENQAQPDPQEMNQWELRQLQQKFNSGVPPSRMHINNAGDLAGLPGSPSRTPLASSPQAPKYQQQVPDFYDLNYSDVRRPQDRFYNQLELSRPGSSSSPPRAQASFLQAASSSTVADKKFRQMLAQEQQIWLREQTFKRDYGVPQAPSRPGSTPPLGRQAPLDNRQEKQRPRGNVRAGSPAGEPRSQLLEEFRASKNKKYEIRVCYILH